MDVVAAMHVQANALVHYGHACFSKTNLPVYTVLPKQDLDIDITVELLKSNFNSNDNVKLCLFYDPDFEHLKGKHYFIIYLACI